MKKIQRNGREIFLSDYSQKVNKRIRHALKRELAYQIRLEIESSPIYIERQRFEDKMESGIQIMKRVERVKS